MKWKIHYLMDYKRGDIVLVNFNPQKRAEEMGKIRPAVIISDTQLNQIMDLVLVVPMTTNLIDNTEPLRIRVKARDNLIKDSDIMCEQIRGVAKSRISKKVSSLNKNELKKLENSIKSILVLS